MAIKDRHEDELMSLDCVQGVGVREHNGRPAINVYVESEDQVAMVPKELEGVPVIVESTGTFEAQ
jgi:hypothetical protein